MKQYRFYIFDFDGTLFDSKESLGYVYKAGFDAIGDRSYKLSDAEIYLHCSLSQEAEYAHISPEQFPIWVGAITKALDYPENIAMIKIFPEVEETIKALHEKGKVIGLATGNSEKHVGLVLDLYHLQSYFGSVAGCTKVKASKPAPDVLIEAARLCGESLGKDTVYIGDSLQDAECAINAGIDGILIDRHDDYPDFKGVKIHDLRELLK